MKRWTEINTKDSIFFYKYSFSASILTIFITNQKQLWKEEISADNLLQRFKENNPALQLKLQPDVFMDFISKLIIVTTEDFEANRSYCYIPCKYVVENPKIHFNYHWRCELSSNDEYFTHLVRPLLNDLNQSVIFNKHFIELLEAKDLEIEQYKIEGAVLERKHLATIPFDSTNITSSLNQWKETIDQFILKEPDILDKFEILKQDKPNGSLIKSASDKDSNKIGKTIKPRVSMRCIQSKGSLSTEIVNIRTMGFETEDNEDESNNIMDDTKEMKIHLKRRKLSQRKLEIL